MRTVMAPVLREKSLHSYDKGAETFDHPAFGLVSISHVQGDISSLFGSDLKHSHFVSLTIKRASVTRDLSNDWYHSEGDIVNVYMSSNQFAELITTPNRGEGVPCTIDHAPKVGTFSESMPSIKKIESKADLFRKEIKDSASDQMAKIRESLQVIEGMLAGDKLSKKDLKAALFTMKCHVSNTPANMEFVVAQAEEALDKAVTAAKADVEAYITHAVHSLGIDAAKGLGLANSTVQFLESKNTD